MKLTFYGGAGEVTGANYVIETKQTKIMIDCGMIQGGKYCEKQNFNKFAYRPEGIQAVFVTHAHIDHIGRLPILVKSGFGGSVYSTPPTKDFAEFLLLDSEHILNENAKEMNFNPPYTAADVLRLMSNWKKVPYYETVKVGDLEIEFRNAGHILGSASIVVSDGDKKIIFSGDLGNMPDPFLRETDYSADIDYALIESAYGGRIHEDREDRKSKFEDLIEDTVKAGGVLMVPAFALERTQEMLFELNDLVENGRIPKIPVFVDSPLAIKLTTVYQKYASDSAYFNDKAISLNNGGDEIFNFSGLRMTLTKNQSMDINNVPSPKIIIAGAGMSNGGRILHHERRYLQDEKSTILFIGYQVSGSLGRQILDGAREVKIFGEIVPVRARVQAIGGYSAHADQVQLLDWIMEMKERLKKVYVVQGEAEAASSLAQKIKDEFAISAEVPTQGESVQL